MVSQTPDAVIVGAGIVGCATAYALAVSGLRPLMLERDSIASHASGFALGELLPWWGPGIPGPLFPFARECMSLHQNLNPSLKEETGIDTGFELRQAISVAFDEAGVDALRDRCRWLVEQGAEARLVERNEVHQVEPRISPEVIGGLCVDGVGMLDAYKLSLALAEAAESHGATIRHGYVRGIEWDGDRAVSVLVGDEAIHCEHLILAAGPWAVEAGEWLGMQVPVKPQRGQILRLDLPGPPVNTYLGWDNCYATTKADGLLWSGSTEEDVGFNEQPTAEGQYSILRGLLGTLPSARDARVVNQTACLRPVSADGLPIFGLVPGKENVYVATGTGRNGLLLAPGIGRTLAQLITNCATTMPVKPFSLDRFNEQSEDVRI